jgi:hypothetical protein
MNGDAVRFLPCTLMLAIASPLVDPSSRVNWQREWLAELLFYRDRGRSYRDLARMCSGCFADAWFQFMEEGERKPKLLHLVRSPRFCLASLLLLLAMVFVASHGFSATRKVLSPLPNPVAGRVALVLQTGRLEPSRWGLAPPIAKVWRQQSRLLEAMALCAFPRRVSWNIGRERLSVFAVVASRNLFGVVGSGGPPLAPDRSIFVSQAFLARLQQEHSIRLGQQIAFGGARYILAGTIPFNFWFASPSVEAYLFNDSEVQSAGAKPMLVVRARPNVNASDLEHDVEKAASTTGEWFTTTAPRARFLRDSALAPVDSFLAALTMAVVLLFITNASRWMNRNMGVRALPKPRWRWWGFFVVKSVVALLLVFLFGVETFISARPHFAQDFFGGPVLIWFYAVSCSLVL